MLEKEQRVGDAIMDALLLQLTHHGPSLLVRHHAQPLNVHLDAPSELTG